MKKSFNKFLTTPIGSLLKTFVYAMLGFMIEAILNKKQIFPPDSQFLWAMFYSGIIAVANVVHNWLNPHYQPYGKKPKAGNLPVEDITVKNKTS